MFTNNKANKKIKLLDFKLTKNLGDSLFGAYKSKFYGKGIDFVKHKEYEVGDRIKHIDWKASSRTDKIYSKVFEEERDLKVLFVINTGSSMNFGIFEKTKKEVLEEIFYSVSMSASFSGDSIGALLYGGVKKVFIDYEKGFGNVFRVLDEIDRGEEKKGKEKESCVSDKLQVVSNSISFSGLTRESFGEIKFPNSKINLLRSSMDRNIIGSKPDNDIKKVFEYLQKGNIKNNLIFFLTDETDIVDDKNLKLLSMTNEIIFFNLFDYFENNLENLDVYLTLSGSNSFLNISLNDKEKIEIYKKERQQKLKKLESFLKKNKVGYKIFDTNGDTFKELFLFFNDE